MCAREVGDRTAWQKMLKGDSDPEDLEAIRKNLMECCQEGIDDLKRQHGEAAFELLEDAPETTIRYPILNWPREGQSA